MSDSSFEHVRICGVKSVLPERYIDIDDELEFFDGSAKKLARAKKMMGYGRRYLADEDTTVTDLAVDAAQRLMAEMAVAPEDVDCLVFVNQKPDYPEPCDACLAHGVLGLKRSCLALNINMGCSGYVHGLMVAHAFISSGAVKRCLLLAGDMCGRLTDRANRKGAPVFGDAASATLLEYTSESRKACFVMGSDGTGWDKIIRPIGGTRSRFTAENITYTATDAHGNIWRVGDGIMQGEEVFKFTMDVAPQLLRDTVALSGWKEEDIDLYLIHQANKQIVENIIDRAGIPAAKAPTDTFSKYANNSTTSVVSVLCDQPQDADLKKIIFCTFGIGLSWGGAAVDISGLYNGGFSTYIPPANRPDQSTLLKHWARLFTGEQV